MKGDVRMQKVKKFFVTFLVLVVLAAVGTLVAAIIVDNTTSSNIEEELKSIPLPKSTSIQASISRTGKLTGTGSLQYYGALFLKSNLSLGELQLYYDQNYKGDLAIKVISFDSAPNEFGENFDKDLRFGYHSSGKNYYILYAFAAGQEPFPMLDYRTYFT